jgi:hypothetical protein
MSILGTEHGRPRPRAERTAEDVPRLGITAAVLFGFSAALLFWGVSARSADDLGFVLGLGFVFLAASVLFLGAFLFFEDWLGVGEADLLDAFASRDWRGRRIPGLRLGFLLWSRKAAEKKLLADQPASSLLAMAAVKNEAGVDQEVATALRLKPAPGEDLAIQLARHPDSSVLTALDFATRRAGRAAEAAAARLPAHLWPRALKALLASRQGPARVAALRCDGIPRRQLVKLAVQDPDDRVRTAAAARIRDDLSRGEALALLSSDHGDTRFIAASSPSLSRRWLVKLCARDPDAGVQTAAWKRLQQDLTPRETLQLSRSKSSDVVRWAISSGGLTRRRLLRLSAGEELPVEVRRLAHKQFLKLLGSKE